MIGYLIKIVKGHPLIFHYIRNQHFLINIITYILQLKLVLTRGGDLAIIFLYHTARYYILHIDEDICVTIKGVILTMPNHMKALDGAIEVMYDEFYDQLKGYDHVLDLGGYIGESAIRLSQYNKAITVYEAHPENYHYLQLNITSYPNINSHNKAVVGGDQKEMVFYGGAFNMGAGNQKPDNNSFGEISVGCENIIKVLQEGGYDAIKMDIEGSEYECMHSIMKEGKDLFNMIKGGIIEFHFYGDSEKVVQTKEIIEWIIEQGYKVECFDAVSSKKIALENIEAYEIIFIGFINLTWKNQFV